MWRTKTFFIQREQYKRLFPPASSLFLIFPPRVSLSVPLPPTVQRALARRWDGADVSFLYWLEGYHIRVGSTLIQ